MKVTIEVQNAEEWEKLLKLLETLEIKTLDTEGGSIRPGNTKANPMELFGLFKESPLDLEQIRKNAWERKGTNS